MKKVRTSLQACLSDTTGSGCISLLALSQLTTANCMIINSLAVLIQT